MATDDEIELMDAPPSEVDHRRVEDEPPVVARLVVEIRSDGSRTIARGAMEDAVSGESVAIEARGDSPISLALGLARGMMQGRIFASRAAKALLPSGRKERGRKKKRRKLK